MDESLQAGPMTQPSVNAVFIDVCVATYRRPALLTQLLASLQGQQFSAPFSLRIIVVDNDPAQSAREIVAAAQTGPWPIEYHVQPEKNIALTRNVAVAASSAEYIAFIDDDERASPGWLQALHQTMAQAQADVVIGPVRGILPPGTARWIRECGLFSQPAQASGTVVPRGATCNALVKAALIPNRAHAFEPRYGLSGGEDTAFFESLKQRGARMVWCQEAEVTETVPTDRARLRWILRRDFRAGQTYADIQGRPRSMGPMLGWLAYRSGLAIGAAAFALVSAPLSRVIAMRSFRKVASNLGQLSTVRSRRLIEYADVPKVR